MSEFKKQKMVEVVSAFLNGINHVYR